MTAALRTLLAALALALLAATPASAQDSAPDDDDSAADDDDSAGDDDDSAGDDDDSAGDDDDSAVEAAPQFVHELLAEAEALSDPPPPGVAVDVEATAPKYNGGLNLDVSWTAPEENPPLYWTVVRAPSASGPWEMRKEKLGVAETTFSDKLTDDPVKSPPLDEYFYKILSISPEMSEAALDIADEAGRLALWMEGAPASEVGQGKPKASWFNHSVGFMLMLLIILTVGGLMFRFTADARAGKDIYIRRIPGIDAIEEGIGRATEMGKPVLYVPGIDELQDIQTIASMLILGEVSKMVAEYQSDIIVSCCIPIVREVADEVVKAGYYQAGYPDAYRPVNTRFISSEQFAFCAGTNGIILREKPATNIYLGRFFAESLILAETGFINKSIQIAGTAEATQLPFFIAACDYTLIGEELFAVSAYLTQDPRLVSSLKASDWIKVFCVACILVGTVMSTLGFQTLVTLFNATGH